MSAKVNTKAGKVEALVSHHLRRKFEKVVVARDGRLQDWALASDCMVKQ